MSLEALDSVGRAVFGAGAAVQAMILLDAVHIPRRDALLRAVLQACAAANAGIGYSVTFGGRGCPIERICRTLDGMGPEVEVIDCDVAHLEDDADIARVAWIYVGEVGLFGKDNVNPLFLLILGRGFGCAAHANHFVEARVHERLDSAVRQKLPCHFFATSGKEIDSIGFVMDGAHAANLRGAGCVDRCERKRSSEFHFCETGLRVHYEPFYED